MTMLTTFEQTVDAVTLLPAEHMKVSITVSFVMLTEKIQKHFMQEVLQMLLLVLYF